MLPASEWAQGEAGLGDSVQTGLIVERPLGRHPIGNWYAGVRAGLVGPTWLAKERATSLWLMAEVRCKTLQRRVAREWKRVGKGNQRKRKQATKRSQGHPSSHLYSDHEEGNRCSQALAARHVSVISEIRRWREGDEPGLQREAFEEEGRQRWRRRRTG